MMEHRSWVRDQLMALFLLLPLPWVVLSCTYSQGTLSLVNCLRGVLCPVHVCVFEWWACVYARNLVNLRIHVQMNFPCVCISQTCSRDNIGSWDCHYGACQQWSKDSDTTWSQSLTAVMQSPNDMSVFLSRFYYYIYIYSVGWPETGPDTEWGYIGSDEHTWLCRRPLLLLRCNLLQPKKEWCTNNTLWDDKDCYPGSKCCDNEHLPWFWRTLPQETSADVEVRWCVSNSMA